MSYIDLTNSFWFADEQKAFTPNETRLYFFLLHLANRMYWEPEWLECGDEMMQSTVGISAVSLRTARNRLKEKNLIDFVVGGKGFRVRTRYQILTPKPHPSPHPIQYYNKIKTKTNNKEISKNKNERFSKREYVASGSDFD